MTDVINLGMEVSGGSRQVRWKAWGQPSQQISSPPSLHAAHSSSLTSVCTRRLIINRLAAGLNRMKTVFALLRLWVAPPCGERCFQQPWKLSWSPLTGHKSKTPHRPLYSVWQFLLKKKAFDDPMRISYQYLWGEGQIDKAQILTRCLLVGAKHLFDMDLLTGFMFDW